MLAESLIDAMIEYLKEELRPLNIAMFVDSEQQMLAIPSYPAIFVLCPEYRINQWFPDYIDASYTLVIGAIHVEANTSLLRRKLYQSTEAIIFALLRGDGTFPYTMSKAGDFTVNFSPIFSPTNEEFIADAQVHVAMKKRIAETIGA